MTADKKVALVTGANRGIGLETARELGGRGFTVVIGARDQRKGDAAVKTLRAEGIESEAIVYDATRPETDSSVREYLDTRYGKLDVLVNNAGMLREDLLTRTVLAVDEQVLEDTFAVNLFAVVRLTRTLLPLLERSEAGRIVNVSSILGSLSLHSSDDMRPQYRAR